MITRGLRNIVLLCVDGWCYARWLMLKMAAVLLNIAHRLIGHPHRPEQRAIELGNLMFPRRWPPELFDGFEQYDSLYPVDLRPYAMLAGLDRLVAGRDVLDLGCGLGGYARALGARGARRVVALEYQPGKAAYAHARRTDSVAVVNASATQLPFGARSFDLVFSNTVFEHLPDVEAALKEVARVLRPEGRALIGFNFFHHRGGHHLFPYVRFPWPTWIVSEAAACSYWSRRLARDQAAGRMLFYPRGSAIRSLSQGNEIGLNRWTYQQFEESVARSGLSIERRLPSETLAQLLPGLVEVLPLRRFLTGTVFYALRVQSPAA